MAASSHETVDRVDGIAGELVLRRAGAHYEIVANGTFLMDTRDGQSERLLVRLAVESLLADGHKASRVLVGGLGVGFSLAEALALDVGQVVVVEREPAIVGWSRTHLARFSDGAVDDPRVEVVTADLVPWLRQGGEPFDAICLDVDNGPDWTVSDGNSGLYAEDGLALLCDRLIPGGVLTVWSAAPSPAFEVALGHRFDDVQTVYVPVNVPRGGPDVIFVATRRP